VHAARIPKDVTPHPCARATATHTAGSTFARRPDGNPSQARLRGPLYAAQPAPRARSGPHWPL